MKYTDSSVQKILHQILGGPLIGMLLSCLVIGAQVFQSPGDWLNRLDYLLFDLRMNSSLALSPQPEARYQISIVEIDEAALAQYGRWPWSRHLIARLMKQLQDAEAAIVVLDMAFTEPEHNPVDTLLAHAPNLPSDVQQHIHQVRQQVDPDQALANTFSAGDTVLGFFFQSDTSLGSGQLPQSLQSIDRYNWLIANQNGYTGNIDLLHNASSTQGFLTIFPDHDGSIRRAPLLMQNDNQLYPALALSAALQYLLLGAVEVQHSTVGMLEMVDGLKLGNRQIATDPSGMVLIPYRASGHTDYPTHSAADILNQSFDPASIEGNLVLIGFSATGLSELVTTPVALGVPGVHIQATLLEHLLNGQFPFRPDWALGANILMLLVLGALLSSLLPYIGPIIQLLTLIFGLLATGGFNLWLWQSAGWDFPLAAQWLLIILLTLTFLAQGFLAESKKKRFIQSVFGQYVPPAHITQILRASDQYSLEGESKEISVLFSDIRAFTSISEALSATQLKWLLNTYLTEATQAIFEAGGTIDKYVGDLIIAFWGAPVLDQNHANHAVSAALNMIRVTEELNPRLIEQSIPSIHIGIGINTGIVNVGDMGSKYRRAYTALGDEVNLASRLESLTKFYGMHCLIGESTEKALTEYHTVCIDKIRVQGKQIAVQAYEVLGSKQTTSAEVLRKAKQFQEAFQLYQTAQWKAALDAFETLSQATPDKKIHTVYKDRIAQLQKTGVPENWDGSFQHESK